MGQVLGVGLTHFPMLAGPVEQYTQFVYAALRSPVVPEDMKDPKRWPEPMQEQWANALPLAREHQARMVENMRALRAAIDDFGPDAVIIFGDDQYENFKEDCIPPFCVYLFDRMESQPFGRGRTAAGNVWGEPNDKTFVHRGDKGLAHDIASQLLEGGFPISYAYTNAHFAEHHTSSMLTHAFLNALLYLDWDRKGFDYPVVPIAVNCYGENVLPSRGGAGHLNPYGAEPEPELAPPGPPPASCFDLGQRIRHILDQRPGKYVVMASSGWSHAFLTGKNWWLWPDVATDAARLADLHAANQEAWSGLTNRDIHDAGEQEFKNWICLAGAVQDRQPKVRDYLETYIFNSNKCFATF